jgi:hypothetical protein
MSYRKLLYGTANFSWQGRLFAKPFSRGTNFLGQRLGGKASRAPLGQGMTNVKMRGGLKKNYAIPEYSSLGALRATNNTRAVQGRPGTFKPPTVVGRVARKKRFGIF